MSREGQRYRGVVPAAEASGDAPPAEARHGKRHRRLLDAGERAKRRSFGRLGPFLALVFAVLALGGVLQRWRPHSSMLDDGEAEGLFDQQGEREDNQPGLSQDQEQESSAAAGAEAPPDQMVLQAAYETSPGMFDGFDRMPKYNLQEPFNKDSGTPYMLADLIKSSSASSGDLQSLQLRGCGHVRVFLTRRPKTVTAERHMSWRDFAYSQRHKDDEHEEDAGEQHQQMQMPWPETGPQDRLLIIDSDSIEDIAVLKMSRLCQELDEDEDLVAVSGEIAGDFTPCKVSIEANTLLYGTRDLTMDELKLDPESGKRCWECDIAPPIFLADPNKLRQAGTWPAKYGPWARLAFFLRNRGKIKVKRCRGLAAFSRPARLNVKPSPATYSSLLQLSTLLRFHRVFDGFGNVRWMGCAKDGRVCKQQLPSQPPEQPWEIVCCVHLQHLLLQHLRTHIGGARTRWQLWRHSLLGVTRSGDLLPWRADAAIAVESRSLKQLQFSLRNQLVSSVGMLAVTSADQSGNFALMFAVPPRIFFDAAEEWKASDVVLNHPMFTGTVAASKGDTAAYELELRTAVRNHQLKCREPAERTKCMSLHSPAVLQVWREPTDHLKVGVQRVTVKDGGTGTGKLPVAQDAKNLLRAWYGQRWMDSKCDWATSAGQCF